MSAQGAHKITADFEDLLCKYTGAPYAVAIDNCCNAMFLALYYEIHVKRRVTMHFDDSLATYHPIIELPSHTYPGVPMEVLHVGGKIKWVQDHPNNRLAEGNMLTGAYQLKPTRVIDSALRFTNDMYSPGYHMCLSFTGPYKHLKLAKGGAILTDDIDAYTWFKKARFSGRHECSYHVDDFDVNPVVGWNFYMIPDIAARGVHFMSQFYDMGGRPIPQRDLSLPYPDLSKFKIFKP
jgi:dTDP-4-amino-4,6-dideoxygalactose transaminase